MQPFLNKDITVKLSSKDDSIGIDQTIDSHQKIQEYVEKKKELYETILMFLEESEENQKDFQYLFDNIISKQDLEYRENFDHFLYLITNICNNHHRNDSFIKKIFQILSYYQDQIKQTYSNIEIFNIFKSNKLILLYLLENKILTMDESIHLILQNIKGINGHNYCHFFYPEIKEFIGESKCENIKEELILKDPNIFDYFNEKDMKVKTIHIFVLLIRNDSIEKFIAYINKFHISLTSEIDHSIFETNAFLIENKPKLIEYAAFFGSIQIFQYLRMNNVQLEPSLWLYAIHSGNAELIYFLEYYLVDFPENNYETCFMESIKCHHNNIANYIIENHDSQNKDEEIYHDQKKIQNTKEKSFSCILQYHNYAYFPSDFVSGYELFYLYLYKYHTLVNLFIKRNEKNIEAKKNNKNEIDVIFFTLLKQTKIDDNYFLNEKKITKIAIPQSIISIGDNAFDECSNLKQIILPSSIVSFGENSFRGCSSIKQIDIPQSLISIGKGTFSRCSSLKNLLIPPFVTSIGDYAFEGCSSLTEISISSSISSLEKRIFAGCSSLTKIVIPLSVNSIGDYAFEGCSSLKKISIPSSVNSIGNYVFYHCSALEQILFTTPSSLTSIGDYSLYECSSLKQISIPSSVNSIGNYVFYHCSALEQILFTTPSSLTSIGDYSFEGCSSLTQIQIPSSVTSIGEGAFKECSSLKQITIPSFVTSIRKAIFYKCTSLTKITIPSSVTVIESYSFSLCSSLTEITIPSSVISIGNCSFYNCSSLKTISIPPSVVKIGFLAFLDCSSLIDVSISHSNIDIGSYSFVGCSSLKTSNPSLLKMEQFVNVDDYEINDLIHEEGYIFNFKATNKKTGKEVVLNAYNISWFADHLDFMEKVIISDFPGLVKVQGFRFPLSDEEKTKVKTLEFQTICDGNQVTCNITEYITITDYMKNGDLQRITDEYLKNPREDKNKMNPTIRSKIIFGVTSIMKNLHKMNVIHRDLKLSTIFLDDNYEPKITCFPFSRFITNPKILEMCVGTPLYMAPEIVDVLDEEYSFPVDVFTYAYFLFRMFSNSMEYTNHRRARSPTQHTMYISKGIRFNRSKNIPDHYWDLIQKCWKQEPKDRPTFEEIINILKNDKFALEENGMKTDLEQLHEYQRRIDID